MSSGNGTSPPGTAEKSLGEIVSEVSEKASLLVREEIELAKAEVTEKIMGIAKGAAVGAAAGVFLIFAAVYFLHFAALIIDDALNVTSGWWIGYAIVTVALVVFAAIAGFTALHFFKKATPPKPELAIEEAKKTRAVLEEARN
ncbi:MAG TPA: phage holin family protein [Thermoleophilaceae bacterium]|nr:phage holin family protein [Thermoleophilaceae bacterium]